MSHPHDAEISELRARNRELQEELNRWKRIIKTSADVIVVTDLSGLILEFNDGAASVMHFSKENAAGLNAASFYEDPQVREEALGRLLASGEPQKFDAFVRDTRGKRRCLAITFSLLCDRNDQPEAVVAVSKDISRRVRLEKRLRFLSERDRLTGLFNQGRFFSQLESEKERARRLNHSLSLLLLDLDGFKEYNDERGHQAGDEVLRRIGKLLFGLIRKNIDTACRYGGDEFTVLLPGAGLDAAQAFSRRLCTAVAAIEGISASVGVALFCPSHPDRDLLDDADRAMYHAKRAGKNRISVCNADGALSL